MSTQRQNLIIENSKIDDNTLKGVRVRLEDAHGTVTFKEYQLRLHNL